MAEAARRPTAASGSVAHELGAGLLRVRVAGATFTCMEMGPAEGPLALCLHGFPDSAVTWRHLLPRLADAGYRAVAPWLRGYAPTEAPVSRRTHPRQLARDVNGLRAALGGDARAVAIGHDWGAIAVHGATSSAHASQRLDDELAAARGHRWARAVTLAVPPPAALPTLPWQDLRQVRLSWYAIVFNLPGSLALLRRHDFALVERLWRSWSPGYEPDDLDRAGWREALARDGARTAIGYYRAMLPALAARRWPGPGEGAPAVPTLHLVGADDGCMHAGQADRTRPLLPAGSQVEVIDRVGHFLHLERPDDVAARVLDFLGPAERVDTGS